MEVSLNKLILFFLLVSFSLSLYADCVSHYKQRATFKSDRYRKDPNPYNKKKADRAHDEAETLEKLVSGKTDNDLDQKVWIACTNFFIDPNMPDGEYNADRFCPLGKMFVQHKKFLDFIRARNASDGYCKPKDIGFLRAKLRDKTYEPRDFIFNLNTEVSVYLAKEVLK
jgi:hypothetical protein